MLSWVIGRGTFAPALWRASRVSFSRPIQVEKRTSRPKSDRRAMAAFVRRLIARIPPSQ